MLLPWIENQYRVAVGPNLSSSSLGSIEKVQNKFWGLSVPKLPLKYLKKVVIEVISGYLKPCWVRLAHWEPLCLPLHRRPRAEEADIQCHQTGGEFLPAGVWHWSPGVQDV